MTSTPISKTSAWNAGWFTGHAMSPSTPASSTSSEKIRACKQYRYSVVETRRRDGAARAKVNRWWVMGGGWWVLVVAYQVVDLNRPTSFLQGVRTGGNLRFGAFQTAAHFRTGTLWGTARDKDPWASTSVSFQKAFPERSILHIKADPVHPSQHDWQSD